jgi:hypothetical protein
MASVDSDVSNSGLIFSWGMSTVGAMDVSIDR